MYKSVQEYLTLNNFGVNLHVYYAEIVDGTIASQEHERIAWVDIINLGEYNLLMADFPIVKELMNY